jgi:hypothetical protein
LRLCAFTRVNKKYFARKAAKASGSQTERITISLRLYDFARTKKEYGAQRRQAAKASGRQTRIRRGGREVDHNSFAPTAAGRSLRLCEKKIRRGGREAFRQTAKSHLI